MNTLPEKLRKLLAGVLSCALAVGPGSAAWAADNPPARASLQGIEVGQDQITLKLTAPVKYNTFVTATPPRLVLEALNTDADLSKRVFAGKGTVLKRVRAGQFAGEPNPIARIVLDLERPVDFHVSASGSDLI